MEQTRTGITRVGYVWYADQLQVLVKWDDGESSSLRVGRDPFRIRSHSSADAIGSEERALALDPVLPEQNAA